MHVGLKCWVKLESDDKENASNRSSESLEQPSSSFEEHGEHYDDDDYNKMMMMMTLQVALTSEGNNSPERIRGSV